MLRSTHVRPFLEEEGGELVVDFLRDPDGRVASFLDRLCRLVRRLEGRPRSTVAEALARQERRVRNARRLDGIAKSLMDRCRFRPPPGADRAEEVREALFRARGADWPPTPGDLRAPYRRAARELGLEEERIDALLYADRPDARLLARAPGLGGERLLALYNLDLARGVLLDAVRVTLTARGGWKGIFRAVKLARLMYRVERIEGTRARGRKTGASYRVELTGPAAPYLTSPRRYGFRFARVVPALTRAPGWSLDAELDRAGRRLPFRLDSKAPLAGSRGRGRPSYDSSFERALAEEFAEKLGEERDGWTLVREGTPVDLGEELLLPDFTLRHEDGREALVEIVGFWTPEYLEKKVRRVAAAGRDDLLLVVYRDLGAGAEGSKREAGGKGAGDDRLGSEGTGGEFGGGPPEDTPEGGPEYPSEDAPEGGPDDALERAFPGRVLRFARKPVIRDVMEAVERVAR